jgi:hypothetical protein
MESSCACACTSHYSWESAKGRLGFEPEPCPLWLVLAVLGDTTIDMQKHRYNAKGMQPHRNLTEFQTNRHRAKESGAREDK